MNKHILVISQYFYPEQFRINDICTEWVKRGYRVTVITGIPNYPEGKYYNGFGLFKKRKEKYKGIEIIRMPLIPRGSNTIMLALNYLSFVVSGYFWKVFTKIKADFVFIFEVSPMTQALPGVWYAKKMKIPCYLYVTDLWPENVEIVAGVTNKRILNTIGHMVDYIYKKCDKIFTSSESFIQAIINRGTESNKLEFWPQYAEDYYQPIERFSVDVLEIPQDGIFNIIFTGNIGYAQGLDILPKVVKILMKDNIRIRFNIVGDGRFNETLKSIVEKNMISDYFNFVDKQPPTRIPELLAVCDAAFLSLADNLLFDMTIPAKLQSYMACGIAIIASASGETAKIINASKAGFCSKSGNAEALANNIIKLSMLTKEELMQLGANARAYYGIYFNKDTLLDKMDKYFID